MIVSYEDPYTESRPIYLHVLHQPPKGNETEWNVVNCGELQNEFNSCIYQFLISGSVHFGKYPKVNHVFFLFLWLVYVVKK